MRLPPVLQIDCGHGNKTNFQVTISGTVLTTTPSLGFNIRQDKFETDFWTTEVDPGTVTYLNNFSGFTYRYPGGLVANSFIWDDAHGFGVAEYLTFLGQVSGDFLYVLNLTESTVDSVALATFIEANYAGARYYQLGNELDRNVYEWTHSEYITACQAHIAAILAVDPNAKFIAFLRQFDYTYSGGGVSRYEDFITEVLTALTNVSDFSLHGYVDGVNGSGAVQTKITAFNSAVGYANAVRPCSLWVTEYSKLIEQEDLAGWQDTSNIVGCLSAADLLIELVQIPEVKTACWQALNGNQRQVFDADMSLNDLSPRAIYWMLRVLNTTGNVYATTFCSTDHGYDKDLNFVAVGSSLWVVNRRPYPIRVKTDKNNTVIHYYIKGEREDFAYNLTNNEKPIRGELIIPPYSVNNYVFS